DSSATAARSPAPTPRPQPTPAPAPTPTRSAPPAPLARRRDRREPPKRGGRDQRRRERCTFRLPIPAQYWAAGVNGEEVTLDHRARLLAQELAPAGAAASRSRVDA